MRAGTLIRSIRRKGAAEPAALIDEPGMNAALFNCVPDFHPQVLNSHLALRDIKRG